MTLILLKINKPFNKKILLKALYLLLINTSLCNIFYCLTLYKEKGYNKKSKYSNSVAVSSDT